MAMADGDGTDRIIEAGELQMPGWYKQMRTVYDPDGISPTLCAGMGEGGDKVKIIEKKDAD